jgi:hypothetical protein
VRWEGKGKGMGRDTQVRVRFGYTLLQGRWVTGRTAFMLDVFYVVFEYLTMS